MTKEDWIKDPFTFDDNDMFIAWFFCRHVWTVTLVTMQPISDDIKIYADNTTNPCRCRQVQTDPKEKLDWLNPTEILSQPTCNDTILCIVDT